jgi:hypothetical protein
MLAAVTAGRKAPPAYRLGCLFVEPHAEALQNPNPRSPAIRTNKNL